MIFRNHLPKQDFRNRLDDNAKAFVVLQSVIMRQQISQNFLESNEFDDNPEYFRRDVEICQEIIDELAVIFSDVITDNIINNIKQSVKDELCHIGHSGSS